MKVFNCKKLRIRLPFVLRFLIVFLVCYIFYDIIILKYYYWPRRPVTVQKDLLDYNEDNLHLGQWPFQIDKHYDVSELRSYASKRPILATADLPGEKGRIFYGYFLLIEILKSKLFCLV